MFDVYIHIGMGQEGHGLGGVEQLGVFPERIPQLIGGIGVDQISDIVPVRLPGFRDFFHQGADQGLDKVGHFHLAFVGRVVQIHGLTVDIHLQGNGGFDKGGMALANNIGKQDHQSRQGNGDGSDTIGTEAALLAVTALE